MGEKLIAFYSRADENYVSGRLKMLEKGNTEVIADIIRDLTNSHMFKIEQEKPYSKGYNDCINEAKKDQENNIRPKLKSYLKSIDDYDEIYLGYPNYWNTMPMAVFTFLEHYDFKDKIIKPFCTHEGSGISNSLKDIKKLCPEATIKEGLAIYGSSVNNAKGKVESWL